MIGQFPASPRSVIGSRTERRRGKREDLNFSTKRNKELALNRDYSFGNVTFFLLVGINLTPNAVFGVVYLVEFPDEKSGMPFSML